MSIFKDTPNKFKFLNIKLQDKCITIFDTGSEVLTVEIRTVQIQYSPA
jgi:hypothetical protein